MVKNQDFLRVRNKFIKFLNKQDKLKTVDDLLEDISYNYMNSDKGIHITRCILWKGVLIDRTKYDCSLNIEYQEFDTNKTYVQIYNHKKGKKLNDSTSWIKEKR